MRKRVIASRLLLLLMVCFSGIPLGATEWIDSAIADLTRQMIRARFLAANTGNMQQMRNRDYAQQSNAFNIVIDIAKWQPIDNPLDSGKFYFHKSHAQTPALTYNTEFNYQDSINAFNQQYYSHTNYVAYYNVVLENFPFNLTKDVSSVNLTSDNTLYNQLAQLKAVKNEDWNEAVGAFTTIISTAAENVKVLFDRQRVLVYGSCALTGFYGPKRINQAKFYVNTIRYTSALNNEPWIEYLLKIPEKFRTPGIPIDNFQKKNRDVALGIQYYLACNLYNNCIAGANIFANRQARWLYENLSTAGNIDKAKLFQTCLELNGLSEFRAWQVLMAGHDDQLANVSSPTSFVYVGATNTTLDKIRLRIPLIKRAENVLRDANITLSRDSVLNYGYLMHRDTGYWKGISLSRRLNLMDVLLAATCLDYSGISDANDPENFCERLVLHLFEQLPAGEEKNFLTLLRTQSLLQKMTYRLDNQMLGFWGGENYTKFIVGLCKYWRKAFPEKIGAGKNSLQHMALFVWDDDFFNNNSWITVNWNTNTISAKQYELHSLHNSGDPEMERKEFDVYDPAIVHTLNANQLMGVPAGQTFVLPALFMDWLNRKKAWADVGTSAQTVLAAIGVAFGVGEIYYAANAAMRGVGILLTAVNTGELILINNNARNAIVGCFATPQEADAFISHYHHIVMMVNSAVIARDLFTGFYEELRAFRLAYQSKQGQLSGALGTNSAEMRALEELNGAIVQEETALGVAETSGAGNIREITLPSKLPDVNAVPRGNKTNIPSAADEMTRVSLMRENEGAEILAQKGYDIEQNPSTPNTTRNPDYKIEGNVFDCYAPYNSNKSARGIWDEVEDKVVYKQQTERVFLNLKYWDGNIVDLQTQFDNFTIPGLKEVMILTKNEEITHLILR